MANKKFVDLNNLKILWNEINEKFLRTSQVEEFMDLITPDIFTSNKSIQLRPNREWDQIDTDFYNSFINFVNSQHNSQMIIDADGCYWDVINKSFYDNSTKKYNGLILSINEEPIDIDGDTKLDEVKNNYERFWYIKANKSIDNTNGKEIYSLKWFPFSIPWGDYIENRVTEKDLNNQLSIISNTISNIESTINNNSNKININDNYITNLINRVEILEKELGILSSSLITTSEFTITPMDQAGRLLSGCSVYGIKSVSSEAGSEEGGYAVYEGNISDIVAYEYVGSQIKVKIIGNYAIKLTISRNGFDNYEIFIPYDSQNKNIKIKLRPVQINEDELDPKVYNKYPVEFEFQVSPAEAANAINGDFVSRTKAIWQYGINESTNTVDKTKPKNRVYSTSKLLSDKTSELSTAYSNKLLFTCVGMKDMEVDVSKNYYGEYNMANPYRITEPIEFRYDNLENNYNCNIYAYDEFGKICNFIVQQYNYDGNHIISNTGTSTVDGKCNVTIRENLSTLLKISPTRENSEFYNDTYYVCPKNNPGTINVPLNPKKDYNKTVITCTITVDNGVLGSAAYNNALKYFIENIQLEYTDDILQLETGGLKYEKNYKISERMGSDDDYASYGSFATLVYTIYNVADGLGSVIIKYNKDDRFESYQSAAIDVAGEYELNISAKLAQGYSNSTYDPYDTLPPISSTESESASTASSTSLTSSNHG